MKVTLLVPTLNEIDGMREIMPKIEEGWCDQILILDGGSTDGTVEYAREHNYDVIIQEKPGLMNAYWQVFEHIRGDIMITFSPDGNSIPEIIPQLTAKIREGYDMVIVSRYLAGAKSEDDTWITSLGNWVFTGLINGLFGGSYTDAMVIYRAYKTSLCEELGLLSPPPKSIEGRFAHMISWEPLLSMRAAKKKLKITEIPGDEPDRIGGEGKCQHFTWGFVYLMEMVQEFFIWNFPTKSDGTR
jgi:glycosyltransferase involved in cell wall biosynthesis